VLSDDEQRNSRARTGQRALATTNTGHAITNAPPTAAARSPGAGPKSIGPLRKKGLTGWSKIRAVHT
jgi:hypothetical protein